MNRTAFLLSRWMSSVLLLLSAVATAAAADTEEGTYDEATVLQEAQNFFGGGAEGLAKVVEKAFKDHGRPNGFIAGEEAGAPTRRERHRRGALRQRGAARALTAAVLGAPVGDGVPPSAG